MIKNEKTVKEVYCLLRANELYNQVKKGVLVDKATRVANIYAVKNTWIEYCKIIEKRNKLLTVDLPRIEYLYNIKGKMLKDLEYEEAIRFKIENAKKLLKSLYSNTKWDIPYCKGGRDDIRINEVNKAIEWNKKEFIAELND